LSKLQKEIFAAGPADTEALGAKLAEAVTAGTHIALQGGLGTGKTTLVRGFLRGLGYGGTVKSPSYTLVECYKLPAFPLFHFDLYRLRHPGELESIGFRDYFDGSGVCLIEWPERAGELLAAPDLRLRFSFAGSGRRIRLQPCSRRGAALLRSVDASGIPSERS